MQHVVTYRQLLAIENDFNALARSGHVVGPARQQSHDVLVQFLHLEFGQVRLERDAGEVVPFEVLDSGVAGFRHVVLPRL